MNEPRRTLPGHPCPACWQPTLIVDIRRNPDDPHDLQIAFTCIACGHPLDQDQTRTLCRAIIDTP